MGPIVVYMIGMRYNMNVGQCYQHSRRGQLVKVIDMTTVPPVPGVYQIVCLATGKRYIGSSQDIKARWKSHRTALRGGYHDNPRLQHAWNKYGEASFQFQIIETTTLDTILTREQHYIDALHVCDDRYGFNIALYAEASARGRVMSEAQREKIRARASTFRHTEETKRMMSERNTGRYFGPKDGRKAVQPYKGKRLPAEWRANQSAGQRGNRSAAKEYIVTNPDGIEMRIVSLKRFCEEHGLTRESMSKVANGRQMHHQGWKCRHA